MNNETLRYNGFEDGCEVYSFSGENLTYNIYYKYGFWYIKFGEEYLPTLSGAYDSCDVMRLQIVRELKLKRILK